MNSELINTIVTLIGSLGFPIAACIALFYFINKTMKEVTTALDNNTSVMNNLIAKIEGMK